MIYSIILGIALLTGGITVSNFVFDESSVNNDMDLSLPNTNSDGWLNLTLPAGDIPDVSLDFVRIEGTATFTLEEIVNYTDYENQTFPLYSFEYDENTTVYGFNPLYILEIIDSTDCGTMNISAFDGYGKIFNVTEFMLTDGEFIKYPTANYPTMVGIAYEDNDVMHWMADWDEEVANEGFRIFGENLPGNMKIENVTTFTFEDAWKVNIFVDDELVGYFDAKNNTDIGNYTTYDWGYYDADDGYGWPGDEGEYVTCSGYTVESILDPFVNDTDFYDVFFQAYDGYGYQKVFDMKDMVVGFDEFDNEGKQPMLMDYSDGELLGYYRGPYQLIAPGTGKSAYIGGIEEIHVMVDDIDWEAPEFPEGPVPDIELNMTNAGVNTTYTMEQIMDFTTVVYQERPILVSSIEIEPDVEVFGFNPLHLMEIEGWGDAGTIFIGASDYAKEFTVSTDLLLRDSNFVKYPTTDNATMLGFMVNESGTLKWLADYDGGSNGNFRVYGDDLEGNQKVKEVTYLELGDLWKVEVTLNGTSAGYYTSANESSTVGTIENYDWGYYIEADGYGWPGEEGDEVECEGYTVASILNTFINNATQNYTVSFIAADGYGGQKVFDKVDIENGFQSDDISNDDDLLAMLMFYRDGDILGYSRGPYQFIAPGIGKGNYIGEIVEIRVTLIPNTPVDETDDDTTDDDSSTDDDDDDDSRVPGYESVLLLAVGLSTTIILFKKHKRV